MSAGASPMLASIRRSALVPCGMALGAHSLLTFAIVVSAQTVVALPVVLILGLSVSAIAVLAMAALLRNRTERALGVSKIERTASPIGHELRTKLAIAILQLNKIQDPRARVVEQDLKELTDSVDRFSDVVQNPLAAARQC